MSGPILKTLKPSHLTHGVPKYNHVSKTCVAFSGLTIVIIRSGRNDDDERHINGHTAVSGYHVRTLRSMHKDLSSFSSHAAPQRQGGGRGPRPRAPPMQIWPAATGTRGRAPAIDIS